MTNGTSFNTHDFSHFHWCSGIGVRGGETSSGSPVAQSEVSLPSEGEGRTYTAKIGCMQPLNPPEGFSDWFFNQHNIHCYDCGEESTAVDKKVNEFDQANGFNIPFSNSFNFKPTRKPRLNELAYPLQHQRYTDSFWLVHIEKGIQKPDDVYGLDIIPFVGLGAHGQTTTNHVAVRFPHGTFFHIREVYSLQDIPERYASVFYREESFPFDSPESKDKQTKDGNWQLSTRNSTQNTQAFEGHVLIIRVTDDRFNLANSTTAQYDQLSTGEASGGQAYYDDHFAAGYHPDPDIKTSSQTINPYAAAKMSKGQLFDFISYSNGILGFRGMKLNIKNSIVHEQDNEYTMLKAFRAPLLSSVESDFVVKTLKNNNNLIAWDFLSADFNGFNYYDRLLGERSQITLSVRSQMKNGAAPASRQHPFWSLGHSPTFYTMFGSLYDLDREASPPEVLRYNVSDNFLKDRLAPMLGAHLYCRQTNSCDWSIAIRIKSLHEDDWWFEIMQKEIRNYNMPLPEIMYISNQFVYEMDHYDGNGSFNEPIKIANTKQSFFNIDIVAYHENLLPTHVPVMPSSLIYEGVFDAGVGLGTGAFDNGREMLVLANNFYDATNTRVTFVPETCEEKAVSDASGVNHIPGVRDAKILCEIDNNLFVTSVLPSTDGDYATLYALLAREKGGHKFYAINISCTP